MYMCVCVCVCVCGTVHSYLLLVFVMIFLKIFNQQKLFYSKKCGAITAVTIEKHRKKKAAFGKAKYAFVEFAHKDSVEVCILVAGTCPLTFCWNKKHLYFVFML